MILQTLEGLGVNTRARLKKRYKFTKTGLSPIVITTWREKGTLIISLTREIEGRKCPQITFKVINNKIHPIYYRDDLVSLTSIPKTDIAKHDMVKQLSALVETISRQGYK